VDVATGTGNVALVAAERGGQVIGVDFEPALLRVSAISGPGTRSATFDG